MTRKNYLAAVIGLYLEAPGSPQKATRSDWAIASTIFDSQTTIEQFAHVVRIASVRRALAPSQQQDIRSLAYYRSVLRRLSDEECQEQYVRYIEMKYQAIRRIWLTEQDEARPALSQPDTSAL
jgi:hypothetical protein